MASQRTLGASTRGFGRGLDEPPGRSQLERSGTGFGPSALRRERAKGFLLAGRDNVMHAARTQSSTSGRVCARRPQPEASHRLLAVRQASVARLEFS
jgi:hypothetical protein